MHHFLYIINGMFVTMKYTLIGVFCGFILACLLVYMLLKSNKYIYIFVKIYISIFRGTPLLIQLMFIKFGLPGLLGIKIGIFAAGIITLTCNSAAYTSQIILAGINGVSKGQFEAAKSLGIGYSNMMLYIVLPQALRIIRPALINEIITLFKDSAILSIIGVEEIMRKANYIANTEFDYVYPFLIAALCYYIPTLILSIIADHLDKNHLNNKFSL